MSRRDRQRIGHVRAHAGTRPVSEAKYNRKERNPLRQKDIGAIKEGKMKKKKGNY